MRTNQQLRDLLITAARRYLDIHVSEGAFKLTEDKELIDLLAGAEIANLFMWETVGTKLYPTNLAPSGVDFLWGICKMTDPPVRAEELIPLMSLNGHEEKVSIRDCVYDLTKLPEVLEERLQERKRNSPERNSG